MRDRSVHANLATWAPTVDIYETENELVVEGPTCQIFKIKG
jgi:hypothetical protein